MNPAVRKSLLIASTIAATALLALVPTAAQSPASSPGGPKPAEAVFKNIQVLKGMPADQLIPAMQFITASLGVECDHCHVQGAFEKDDKKPKQTARGMMKMMFAINHDNFDSKREVTCFSCHRGSLAPMTIPLVAEESQAPPQAHDMAPSQPAATTETKPNLPGGDELLAKYIHALGGEATLRKVSTRVAKGNVTLFGGRQFPIEIFENAPEQKTSVVHSSNGDNVTTFNGQAGWLTTPGRPQREMGTADMDGSRLDEAIEFPERSKNTFGELKTEKAEKIGDHDTYLVVGTRTGLPPVRLYFDQQSGLLVRIVRYAESPLGHLPTQIDLADFRQIDGVQVPFRWTTARPSGRTTLQLDQVQNNLPIDPGKFAKPAPPAPPGGAQ